MKYFLIVFSLFLVLACNGQRPDTLFYFDEDVHNAIVDEMQSDIDSIQSLLDLCRSALNSDELSVIADTFNLEIVDDRIKIELNKINHDVWIDIIDGSKRLNADYIIYEYNILVMDSTYTVGSMYLR